MSDEQWYVVHDSIGKCVSIGTVLADPMPEGLSAVQLSSDDASAFLAGLAVWDAATRSVKPLPPVTPASVTARQIRLWLVRHGVSLAAVEAAIDAIPDQATRDSVRVEWEYAPYVERSHPWLAPLATALGLDEAGIDAAFREAATL